MKRSGAWDGHPAESLARPFYFAVGKLLANRECREGVRRSEVVLKQIVIYEVGVPDHSVVRVFHLPKENCSRMKVLK